MNMPPKARKKITRKPRRAKPKADEPIDFEAIGADLGRLIEIKEQMLGLAKKDENPFFVPLYLAMLRDGCRHLREDLEKKLREGKLGKRMSSEKAQQAIYGLQLFEDSLRVDRPKVRH